MKSTEIFELLFAVSLFQIKKYLIIHAGFVSMPTHRRESCTVILRIIRNYKKVYHNDLEGLFQLRYTTSKVSTCPLTTE